MKRLLSILILVTLCACVNTQAHNVITYNTEQLESIATTLSLDTLIQNSVADSTYRFDSERGELCYNVNKYNEVDHIGLSLFSDEVKEAVSPVICNFIERYILFADLNYSDDELAKMMSDNNIELLEGDVTKLFDVNKESQVTIDYEDKSYVVEFRNNKIDHCKLKLPAQYELLVGANKREIEQDMIKRLERYEPKRSEEEYIKQIFESRLLPTPQSNYFIAKGSSYLIDAMRSDLYYEKSGNDEFQLIHDSRHPHESVINLLNAYGDQYRYNLVLKVNQYGKKGRIECNMVNWIALCLDEGCSLYCGIESSNSKFVEATSVVVNEELGYCHILFVKIPIDTLTEGNDEIEGTLNCYVPMHNVENLFEKYK